ncbi:MAG: RNA methyltransferase [Bacteroidaceae bacterium]|nr:RNA methyltransferase [Bacteroidaceae bacterium]
MNEIETITSVHNPRIRQLLLLQQKSAERRKAGLFVVEGRRELQHCIDAGYEIDTVFYSEELGVRSEELGRPPLIPLKGEDGSRLATSNQLLKVSGSLYERIAYRGSTEGVIALVRSRSLTLADLQLGEAPLVMVLERVEKPGNLGAVLRSADAAGVDAVIVCDPLTDLYNPNLIRSSIGAVFTVPCVACSSDECIAWLKDNGISILTAQLQDSSLYYDTNMTGPTAIVMGTEATGLTEAWRQAADAHIRIPMLGRLDSLNVSVSAAILLYEAVRQRTLKS